MDDFKEFVDKVKAANPLEDVVDETGPEWKLARRHGRYMRGEIHDSLVVNVDEGYYVWNDQGEKGDHFNWLEARRGFDFWESLQFLARRAKIEIPADLAPSDNKPGRIAARVREDVYGIVQRVFSRWLWDDAEALAYVRGRGWLDETIQQAGIGFSGRTAAAQIQDLRGELQMHEHELESPTVVAMIGYRGDVRAWGEHWNVQVQSNWIEWKMIPGMIGRTRIIYPHWDGGRVVYMTGRNILGAEVTKEGRIIKSYNPPKELVGERRPFFNHVYGRRADECVVFEGQGDAVSLAQLNIPAVAICGTQWADHSDLLHELRKRHERLYLGLDNDDAGEGVLVGKGEWPLAKIFGPMGRVVRWESQAEGVKGKDANDWLLVHAPLSDYTEAKEQAEAATTDEEKKAAIKAIKEVNAAHEKKAGEVLMGSLTFVEEMAQWTGKQKGSARDEAQRMAFGLIAKMDKLERAQYRSRLAEFLKIGVREFNDILKAAATGTDDEDRPITMVETMGGYIDGWLVEYLYDPAQDRARLAYRDPERKIGVADYLDIDGARYYPKQVTGFVRNGGVLFPSELGQLKPTRELVAIIESFIHRHYLLENKYMGRIIAYYVLMTWVYDSFHALCYLRAIGEAGSGKSELMRRIGYVCYRMMTASGAATAASFFRATEMYRGTVFIDEADLHDGGDMSNDLVKFLNLGAMDGNPIWRLEEVTNGDGDKSYEVATFATFCPKLIAMRKDFKDDAVGSRSLTIKLMPREPMELKAAGIRLYIDDEFRAKALTIRNLMLRWRLQHWEPEIEVNEEHMDMEISSRLNQVTMPLKALAKDDLELKGEIERFLRAYNREIVLTRSMTIAARIVEAMWKIYRYEDLRLRFVQTTAEGEEFMMIGDVRTIANEIMDEMNSNGSDEEDEDDEDDERDEKGKKKNKFKKRKKDALTARGVGHIVRNELQLQVGDRRGAGFPVFWDDLKMRALGKRFGVDFDSIPAHSAPVPAPDDSRKSSQLEKRTF